MASLKAIHNQLTAHIGVSVAAYYRDPKEHIKQAFIMWKSGRSCFPPTWKSLLSVLKNLNLEELSQQIKDYLFFGESGTQDYYYFWVYFLTDIIIPNRKIYIINYYVSKGTSSYTYYECQLVH